MQKKLFFDAHPERNPCIPANFQTLNKKPEHRPNPNAESSQLPGREVKASGSQVYKGPWFG